MKLSASPRTRDQITCAIAPAMATPVASRMLPVIRYSARKTMVEKKSVASRANTSFMVYSFFRHCEEILRRSNPACFWALDCFAGARNDKFRISGGLRHRGYSILLPLVLRIPFCKIQRAVSGGESDGESDPERQAR